MIHARLLVEREVVQGKRDEEAFNRVFGQSLHYSSFFLLFSFSAFCASESCEWAEKVETMVWRFEGADVWCMFLFLALMPLLLIGEEGSKENLVGLDVGDRPLFVQVSPILLQFLPHPHPRQIWFETYASNGYGCRD
jgi:hypothetical protein